MGARVSINGAGHQVDVQHDGGDLSYVVEKAQKLWEDTRQPEEGGASFGFAAERQTQSSGRWLGRGDQPAVK